MIDKEKLLKFKQIKDVKIGKRYIIVYIKGKIFSYSPELYLEIFDYLDSEGYVLIGQIAPESGYFIFKKEDIKVEFEDGNAEKN